MKLCSTLLMSEALQLQMTTSKMTKSGHTSMDNKDTPPPECLEDFWALDAASGLLHCSVRHAPNTG